MTPHRLLPLLAVFGLPLAGMALTVSAAATSHAVHGDHGAHGTHAAHGTAGAAGDATSTRAFLEANARMHGAMDIPFTGDADVDFVRGMIGHHEGAIDMARIVLEHGQDPEIRALAEAIVAAQAREIAAMRAWLAARGQ